MCVVNKQIQICDITRIGYIPEWFTGWPLWYLAISDQYATFIFLEFVHKMAAGGHFRWPKNTWNAFFAISGQYATFICSDFFHKMAADGHFGWPKITFDRISRYFRSISNFFFSQNGCCSGHFGWPKITFDRISRHFRSIRNFFFLDDRKSLSITFLGRLLIAFLAISDQYTIFFLIFFQNGLLDLHQKQ